MKLDRRHLLGGAAVTALCGKTAKASVQPTPGLAPLKWAPRNHRAIESLIATYGNSTTAKRPYAVFDWDNTSVMGDSEETLFRYVIDRFCFVLTPAAFSRTLRYRIPAGPFTNAYRTTEGQPILFDAIATDIETDYTEICARYGCPADPDRLEALHADPAFASFRAKLLTTYEALDATHGYQIAYRWIVRVFAGRSVPALEALAHASNRWHLSQSIARVVFTTPRTRPGRTGCVDITVFQCLRLTPEIADLQACLQRNGIDVFVVSASLEPIIAAFATDPAYGYGLERSQVLGVRVAMDGPLLGIDDQPGWPMTNQAGKVEVIRREIAGPRGYGPLCVFGDSDGDVNMLTEFPDTRLSLVVNRILPGKIGGVSRQAEAARQAGSTRFLLQGRDETVGEWRPDERTISFGTSAARLLA